MGRGSVESLSARAPEVRAPRTERGAKELGAVVGGQLPASLDLAACHAETRPSRKRKGVHTTLWAPRRFAIVTSRAETDGETTDPLLPFCYSAHVPKQRRAAWPPLRSLPVSRLPSSTPFSASQHLPRETQPHTMFPLANLSPLIASPQTCVSSPLPPRQELR